MMGLGWKRDENDDEWETKMRRTVVLGGIGCDDDDDETHRRRHCQLRQLLMRVMWQFRMKMAD